MRSPSSPGACYTPDPLGNRTQTLVMDGGGSTTAKHSSIFDALGRMLADTGGASQTTIYRYDSSGNRTRITDPLGRVTSQVFDALNRVASAEEADQASMNGRPAG